MPPPTTLTTQPDLGANQEGARQAEFLSVPVLARGAQRINDELRLGLSGSKLRKLVRRFVREGGTSLAELEAAMIAYCDPTGETAVRNVQRERGF